MLQVAFVRNIDLYNFITTQILFNKIYTIDHRPFPVNHATPITCGPSSHPLYFYLSELWSVWLKFGNRFFPFLVTKCSSLASKLGNWLSSHHYLSTIHFSLGPPPPPPPPPCVSAPLLLLVSPSSFHLSLPVSILLSNLFPHDFPCSLLFALSNSNCPPPPFSSSFTTNYLVT